MESDAPESRTGCRGHSTCNKCFYKKHQGYPRKKIFEVSGLPASLLESFSFENTMITAESIGQLEYTKNWTMNELNLSVTKKEESKRPGSIEEKERLQ